MRSLLQILALSILSLPLVVSGAPTPDGDSEAAPAAGPIGPRGIDLSERHGFINWDMVRSDGIQFAYIQATQGTRYIDPALTYAYAGTIDNGIIHGAYHSALPNKSPGAVQAEFFLANGGVWFDDGKMLPGAISLRGSDGYCFDLSQGDMVKWIQDFSNTYREVTGRLPVIFTSTNWWVSCTGNSDAFGENPLWIVDWGSSIGPLPASWSSFTFRQYAGDSENEPGNNDYFNGDFDGLKRFALGN